MKSKRVYKELPISDVEMDVGNPRIAKFIEMYGEPTAEDVHLALGAGSSDEGETSSSTTFYSLRESIKTNGGIIHPIIVNETAESKIVIEGNTRLLIYNEFKEKGVSGDWGTIPAMVYQELSQEQIDSIRLQAHLVGTRDWDPYSKAKYLDHLRNSDHLTLSQMVDYCGGRKREVVQLIDAYNDMEKYYREAIPDDSAFDVRKFSAFVELQKKRGKIVSTLRRYDFNLYDFARWVHKQLIYPLNTVRHIIQILEDNESRKMFLKSGAKSALKMLEKPSEVDLTSLTIDQLAQAVTQRLNRIMYEEIKEMKQDNEGAKAQSLLDLNDSVKDICNDIFSSE